MIYDYGFSDTIEKKERDRKKRWKNTIYDLAVTRTSYVALAERPS